VIRLPDGRYRVVGVVADRVAPLALPGDELPEARAEVGGAEDRVQRETDERKDQRYVVEVHQAISSGAR
jgi:hypothetical protein